MQFNVEGQGFGSNWATITTILVAAHQLGDVEIVVARPELFGAGGRLMIGLDEYSYSIVDGKIVLAEPLRRAFGAGSLVVAVTS